MRISNSFSEGEIQVLEFIVQTLLRGGTPTMATRSADFPSLCRKVQAMKKKVHEQKARPLASGNAEESSVGTVAAPTLVEPAHADVMSVDADMDSVHASVDIARAV
jgi:hypothetical protein